MKNKPIGRKPEYDVAMKHVGLRLPVVLIDKAVQLGAGTFSKGVRLALEQANDKK